MFFKRTQEQCCRERLNRDDLGPSDDLSSRSFTPEENQTKLVFHDFQFSILIIIPKWMSVALLT